MGRRLVSMPSTTPSVLRKTRRGHQRAAWEKNRGGVQVGSPVPNRCGARFVNMTTSWRVDRSSDSDAHWMHRKWSKAVRLLVLCIIASAALLLYGCSEEKAPEMAAVPEQEEGYIHRSRVERHPTVIATARGTATESDQPCRR